VDDPNAMTRMIFDAVAKTGQRALVSKGWGGLGGAELEKSKPDNIFMLGNCPHDWLFQHVSCVVHHGGAGTTAAGIALGQPTVIVPFFGDQPFWGAMVARAGAGPAPTPYKELTAQKLADAILYALRLETKERARELGEKIREERGCESGARSFHAAMDVERMRRMMVPDKPAVWRVKTKGADTEDVRLSAFAAAVLGNEGVIDVNQLRLYRPCEHAVEALIITSNLSGPNPVLSTLGSVASGVAHWPINVAKAWGGVVYEPYKGAKKDGWRGFGKGLGRGFGHVLFPQRGLVINGTSYGTRALYHKIKKHMGSGTLSFILAANFALGFEEVHKSTEEDRLDVLRRWNELAPELKREQTGSSYASSMNPISSRDSASTSPEVSRINSESTTRTTSRTGGPR
jgi:UDP-glucoronosyl and UDP-glucosyl transferase